MSSFRLLILHSILNLVEEMEAEASDGWILVNTSMGEAIIIGNKGVKQGMLCSTGNFDAWVFEVHTTPWYRGAPRYGVIYPTPPVRQD